jgi:hypothetical protein
VHDLFDVLGLPRNAPVGEIRRVCARRSRRSHPDFRPAPAPLTRVSAHAPIEPERPVSHDVAIDFVDVTALFDRIELAFFAGPR